MNFQSNLGRFIALLFLLSASSCQVSSPANHSSIVSPSSIETHSIHWNVWNEEVFKTAKDQDKLILLDLTAVWCHACHVMDETTYADSRIVDLLNTKFISVRVDTDQRPDIDARYRQGGWPTTSILLPSGEILFQANFLAPEDLEEALRESENLYREKKNELVGQAEEIWGKVQEARTNRVRPTSMLDAKIVEQTLSTIEQNFDETHGGFRDAPKFFEPETITFLFRRYHESQDQILQHIALFTLKQQQKLIDPVWGGFYRYAVEADWTNPHFEKMLHLQALNLQNYLEAYQLTGEHEYRAVVDNILDYVRTFLTDEYESGFLASQDADIKDSSKSHHIIMSGEEYFGRNNAERMRVGVPYVDQTIYTGWNGLMIQSCLKTYQALGNHQILELALRILNSLFRVRYEPGKGMAHLERNGQPKEFGLLGDQVAFAGALLEAWFTTGIKTYLVQAEQLTNDFTKLLQDSQGGGLYDRPINASSEGLLKFPHKPLPENLRAAILLSDLFYVTNNHAYRDVAKQTLQYVLGSSNQHPLGLIGMALARYLQYPVHVVVVGPRESQATGRLFREALKLYAPGKIIRLLDPASDSLTIGEITFPASDEPRAYVCTEKLCSEPISDASELDGRYKELREIIR